MINEFSSRLKPRNRLHVLITVISLAVGAVIFTVGALLEHYSGVVQAVALPFFAASLYLLIRYCLGQPVVEVAMSDEGRALLILRTVNGKRQTTNAFVYLSTVTSVKAENAEQRRAHSTPRGCAVYKHLASLNPDLTYRITAGSYGGRVELVVECPSELAKLIEDYAAIARAAEPRDEDD